MKVSLVTDLVLAALVSFFNAMGDSEKVETLRKLIDAKRSGANVDEHMQRVADSLLSGAPRDWDALNAEIDATVANFMGD